MLVVKSLRVKDREDGENIGSGAGFVFVLSVCGYRGFWEGGIKGGRTRQTQPELCWAFSFSGLWFTLRVLTCPWLVYSGKGSRQQLLAGQLHGIVFDYYLMCRMKATRAWWPSLFMYIFLLCERGKKSWLPLRDMNTVKQKSAQNPRSHGACPRQEVGPQRANV